MYFADKLTKYDRTMQASQRDFILTFEHRLMYALEKEKTGPQKGKFVKVLKKKMTYDKLVSISMR